MVDPELRTAARVHATAASDSSVPGQLHGSMLRIDASGPFDHRAALDTLAAHAVDGLHRIDRSSATLTRWLSAHGETHPVTIQLDARGATVQTTTKDTGINTTLAAQVRHCFDLDTDLTPINDLLGADPVFATQVHDRPGMRITRFHPPFEAAVLTVIGQQVSLAAARLFGARLVAGYGTDPAPHCAGLGLREFPTPAALAAAPSEQLRSTIGLTTSRTRTVQEVARLFAERTNIDQLPPRSELGALHGIGPWTLDYLAIRSGSDPDAFPASDAVLRRRLTELDRDTASVASWAPFRSYAATRLWAMSV